MLMAGQRCLSMVALCRRQSRFLGLLRTGGSLTQGAAGPPLGLRPAGSGWKGQRCSVTTLAAQSGGPAQVMPPVVSHLGLVEVSERWGQLPSKVRLDNE